MRHLGHASISRIDENNSWVKNSGIDSPCRLLPLVEAFIDAEEAQHTAQAVGHAMGVEGWTGGVVVDGGGKGEEGLTLFGCPHRSSGLAACQGSVWGWSRSDALLCVAAPLRDNPFCPIRAVGPAVRRLGDARLCEPPLNAGAGEIGVREGDSAGGSWRMRERPSFVRGRSTVIIVAIVARVWLVWNWLNMR